MPLSHDIVVSGAGLVGASFALALARSGLRVALVEPLPPSLPPADAWDTRIYAISPGSAAFLDSCGAWQILPRDRVTRVENMVVHGDRKPACLRFSAYESGLPELAFIAENGRLQQALWQRALEAEHITVHAPAAIVSFEAGERAVEVALADGSVLSARLLVGADGGESPVRQGAGIAVERHPYPQSAVVANFAAERPHDGTAYQWFRPDGILALLPLARNQVSMVWSTGEPHAAELLGCTAAELGDRVSQASEAQLGALTCVTPPAAFPLRLARVERLIAPRVALIGDAAHNVHPLAGQGVNLGFRDARELARVLSERGPQPDCGDRLLLRRYERARREDILAMQLATDGLQKLFSSDAVLLSAIRNAGLSMVDRLAPVKKHLARQAIA